LLIAEARSGTAVAPAAAAATAARTPRRLTLAVDDAETGACCSRSLRWCRRTAFGQGHVSPFGQPEQWSTAARASSSAADAAFARRLAARGAPRREVDLPGAVTRAGVTPRQAAVVVAIAPAEVPMSQNP
jgi:hypothetical protein